MDTSLDGIQNFLQIDPALGTAGQPTREQFPTIAQAGFEAVINLAMPNSLDALPDEAALAETLGLAYVHIPVVWTNPRPEDLRRFFGELERRQGQRVFVHCARNMRVSAFVFLYRVLRRGEAFESCRQDMLRIWEPNDTWMSFIESNLSTAWPQDR